jgi:hypothetical protein
MGSQAAWTKEEEVMNDVATPETSMDDVELREPAKFCHLADEYMNLLCGEVNSSFTLDAVYIGSPAANCLGPTCDGPEGCKRPRCPACVDAWLLGQISRPRSWPKWRRSAR